MRALASALGVVFLVVSVGAADADNKGKGNSSKNFKPEIKFVSAFKAPKRPGHSYNQGHHGKWDDWKHKWKHKWPSKGPKKCREDDDALEMIRWGSDHDRGKHKGWSKAKYCPKPPVSAPSNGGEHGHGNGHHHHDWWHKGKGKGHIKFDSWTFSWRR